MDWVAILSTAFQPYVFHNWFSILETLNGLANGQNWIQNWCLPTNRVPHSMFSSSYLASYLASWHLQSDWEPVNRHIANRLETSKEPWHFNNKNTKIRSDLMYLSFWLCHVCSLPLYLERYCMPCNIWISISRRYSEYFMYDLLMQPPSIH